MSARVSPAKFNSAISSAAWLVVALAAAAIADPALAAKKHSASTDDNTTAERLVAESADVRVEGDVTRSLTLLREAVDAAPDYRPARGMLGQLRVGNEWLAVEEAQRRAAADPQQANYAELRQQYGETPGGQLALARWCRKNNLSDEARFHWASVLSIDPTNEEALKVNDLRWVNGRLVTRDNIATAKEEFRKLKKALKAWEPKIAKWRREMSGKDAGAREAALEEIRSSTEVTVIPALEEITLSGDAVDKKQADTRQAISEAFIQALAKIPDQAATESLARHAVFSPFGNSCAAAIEQLKQRPAHDFVPMLLAALAMPLESSFSVRTTPDGSVHYAHSLYREGQDSDWSMDARLSAVQNDLGGRHYTYDVTSKTVEVGPRNGGTLRETAKKDLVTSAYQNRYAHAANSTEIKVAQANLRTDWLNDRITNVLTSVTGQKLETPKHWWDWWTDYNEYYVSDERPVDQHYYSKTDNYNYGYPTYDVRYPPPPPPPPPRPGGYRRSCFAHGTPIWTKTGQRPIETLQLGDLVLSQNIDTGELTYKPIIGRTVRPPSPILKLSFGKEKLLATKGHPLWVEGIGWRMAKELEDGAIVHAVTGAVRMTGIESVGEDKAYNLVVADYSTYFVGESGILVHDNTPRKPTRAIVPGVVVATK
jgi:hypothetical protein